MPATGGGKMDERGVADHILSKESILAETLFRLSLLVLQNAFAIGLLLTPPKLARPQVTLYPYINVLCSCQRH